MTDHLIPGSFSVNGTNDLAAPLSWKDLLFFSFTTLTSTGYGGIVPTAGHAQSPAILEQLAGVFYVAILITRSPAFISPAPCGDRRGAQVEPMVLPGPSVEDAPSAGFFAWRRELARSVKRDYRAPRRCRIASEFPLRVVFR